VRGWVVSTAAADKRAGRKPKSYFFYISQWYKTNRRIKKFLLNNNIDFVQVGYEELCFDSESTIDRILDFVKVPKNEFSLLNEPNTHIAYGNRMKKDKSRRKNIVYDYRWISKYWLNLLVVLLPPVFFWNKKNVYGNK